MPLQRLTGEPPLCLAIKSLREEAPGIHRDEATEDPCQSSDPEQETGDMMPIEPTAIGREIRSRPDLSDAEIESDRRQEGPEHRRPDENLTPQRDVPAQSCKVEPVRYCPDPIPKALCCRGPKQYLSRFA